MSLQQAHLFFGIPVDLQIQQQIDQLSPEILEIFFSEQNLEKITKNSSKYIGKKIEGLTDLEKLELTRLNILSIIKKFIPETQTKELSLALIAYL